jgi:flagellar biosynthesis protein FlhA
MWIPQRMRERAEMTGYTVVEPSAVIATHLTEMIKANAWEILTRQETQALIDHVKKTSPAVADELIPNLMSVGDVQKVLQHLLRERISVRNLVTILETLADNASKTKDTDALGELVRIAMARSICKQFADENVLNCVTLDPSLELELQEKIQPGMNHLMLEPATTRLLLKAITSQVDRMVALGHSPVVICIQPLRLALRRFTERSLPQLVILSYNEIVPQVEVRALGNISMTR